MFNPVHTEPWLENQVYIFEAGNVKIKKTVKRLFGYFVIAMINPFRSKTETTMLRCLSSILRILDSIVLKVIIVYCLFESHLCDSLSRAFFLCCMC